MSLTYGKYFHEHERLVELFNKNGFLKVGQRFMHKVCNTYICCFYKELYFLTNWPKIFSREADNSLSFTSSADFQTSMFSIWYLFEICIHMESISFLDPYGSSIILSDEISSQVGCIMCKSSEFEIKCTNC